MKATAILHRLKTGVVADALSYASEGAIRLLLTGIVGIVVARYLGPSNLGLLVFVGSTFTLLAPISRLGLPQILVREFSTTESWRPLLASALLVQAPVAIAAGLASFAVVAISRQGDRDALLIAAFFLPLPLLGLGESFRAMHQARRRIRLIVATGLVSAILASTARLALVGWAAPVWLFAAVGTLEVVVLLVGYASGVPEGLRLSRMRSAFDAALARGLLQEGWPLLLAAVAVTIYMKSDLLMLGLLAGDQETGIYSAAARLSEMWYFAPVAVTAATSPRLARMYSNGESSRYAVATQRLMTALVAGSLVILVVTVLLAEPIIGLLYGDAYENTVPVLRVHALAGPFVFAGVAASQIFVDRRMTRITFVRSAAGAAVNVVLNLALIPPFGALGASIATLVAYAFAGIALNASRRSTRSIAIQQVKAFGFSWPRWPTEPAT